MTLVKPLTVNIRRPGSRIDEGQNDSLQAKHRYDLECEATGSNPPAIITWYKGKRPLKHVRVSTNIPRKLSTSLSAHLFPLTKRKQPSFINNSLLVSVFKFLSSK